ncbi:hypothetical protein [Calycomorphotria hydatis]|uniref:Uncharacterized protein n=1 Tax=Calycomorphotria hydatis TaxID=2528027 RepID=A0A517T8R5_9PLAN|nr:hypothetical protein [Calycomorphotria hydatis]QDT64766.1 hypothetical protein V22_20070 [Calycomorphotria hydatis]
MYSQQIILYVVLIVGALVGATYAQNTLKLSKKIQLAILGALIGFVIYDLYMCYSVRIAVEEAASRGIADASVELGQRGLPTSDNQFQAKMNNVKEEAIRNNIEHALEMRFYWAWYGYLIFIVLGSAIMADQGYSVLSYFVTDESKKTESNEQTADELPKGS